MTPKELAKQLRNIGPVTSKQLLEVGIDSLATLKKVGVKETYKRLCVSVLISAETIMLPIFTP